MVDITELSPELASPEMEEAVAQARRAMAGGSFNVFDGEMKTNDGRIAGVRGGTLPDSEIIGNINWYYHTVIEP
jgi:hypothetical protein